MTHPALDKENIDGALADVPHIPDKVGDLIQATRREEAFDEKFQVTLPAGLVDIADRQEPPVLVHLMQPHTPFIGEVVLAASHTVQEIDLHPGKSRVYGFVGQDLVDVRLVRLAYWMNFIEALRAVDTFLSNHQNMDVVLTADHGEVINQNHVGHGGKDDPQNQIVPWIEISI